jgi:predicted membrane protein
MLRVLVSLVILYIIRTQILRGVIYSYYVIKNRLLYTNLGYYALRFLSILIPIIYMFCNIRCAYAMGPDSTEDIARELIRLKEELDYWQADTQELITRYAERGYKYIHDSNLSEAQLRDKEEMSSNIKDGRNNVKTSIKELAEFKAKHNISQDTSVLGKRSNTQPESSNQR